MGQDVIARLFDADRANAIINHDDVREFVSFDDTALPMDLGPVVADERNILLMSENGGFLFAPKSSDGSTYELHTFFLKAGRGRELVRAAHDAFEWMFCRTPARQITTYAPDDCPHAKPPLSFGWRPYFWRANLAVRGGRNIGAVVWKLDFWDWAANHKTLRTATAVLSKVGIAQREKAEFYAAQWREWTGEECQ